MTRILPLLLIGLLLAVGAPALHAQHAESDPRHAEDPRADKDPRSSTDPRVESARRDTGKPREELEGRELLEALWAEGATSELSDVMREEAWEILGWIDAQCEEWLSLVESGALDSEQGRARAAELVAKAEQLARLADGALRDTRFSTYVHRFTNWDAEQQASFRAGQEAFGKADALLEEARTNDQALEALTWLERSLGHARPLGDIWGMSMTLASMGRVQHANRQFSDARATMREAVELGRSIRDLDTVWEGLNVIYQASMMLREYEVAREALRDQYQLSLELDDRQSARRALQRMLQLEAILEDARGR